MMTGKIEVGAWLNEEGEEGRGEKWATGRVAAASGRAASRLRTRYG